MRKLTFTMKTLMLLAAFIWPALSVMGQTVIDFETADAGYTPSITDGSGNTDVFNRTDAGVGTNTSFYWAAEDLSVTDPSITLDQIDVSGNTAFNFSVDLLTPNSNDWDVSDEVLITYSLDGGASQNLMWIQSNDDGDDFNAPAAIDADFDGTGDDGSELPAVTDGFGAGVGNDFVTFTTPDIALSGNSTLDITIQFVGLTSGDEGLYMDNITITVSGGTPDPEPDNHVADFAAVADDAANVTLTWTDNDGAQPADAFLIKANTGAITAPVDGTEEADDTDLSDGSGAINVASGVGTYTFSGLSGSTKYYFEIYPYTNSGADIDYKTDGTVPVDSATTLEGTIDWANLQWPESGTITQGDEYNVYAQVYEAGVTDAGGQGAGIEAWIGYSTEDTDPSTWTNWVAASYNQDQGNNDEYMANLGAEVPVGDFFYASRFQLNGGDYYYGGYNSGGGGAWDGTTNVSGTLTVERPMATVPYSATFDADLGDMYTYSVSGDTKEWYHDGGDQAAAINGFNSGDIEEDWMILPGFDLSVKANEIITFDTWYNYGSDDANNYLKLMYSTDYAGTGDPSGATWTELGYTQPGTSETWTGSGDVDLSAIDGASVFIAFKYRYESGSYRYWKVDNISVAEAPVGEPPVVENIVATPDAPTSSDAVSISADITDADGTIDSVALLWGTVSGTLEDTINMSASSGDTYVTDTDIPAQADSTTVYYEIVAEDNDGNVVSSLEMMYEVTDPASTTIPYSETFDTDLGAMYTYSVSGATKEWYHDGGAQAASVNGYDSGDDEEDWMIMPAIDLSAKADLILSFDTWWKFGDLDATNYLKLMYSEDYAGVGDPSGATWTELTFDYPASDETWTSSGDIDLSAITGSEVYFAFKYAGTSGSYRNWKVDNISVAEAPVGEPPVVENIVATPDAPTSSDAVSISADITDADGTIDSVALLWGTVSGTLEDTINMSASSGDTYVTDTDIPAQADGTTVYYQIVAVDNDMNETVSSEMMYEVVDITVVQVADVAELRAQTADETTVYELTGEAFVTYQEDGPRMFIQDATGAIMLYDNSGAITSTYNRYDGVTGVTGTLKLFSELLELVPTEDPGAATSTGNTIVPDTVTIPEVIGAVTDYESELVIIEGLTFADAGNTFAYQTSYDVTDGTNTFTFRTQFENADYIGTTIPSGPQNIVGLVGNWFGAAQISARDLADITPAATNAPIVSEIVIDPAQPSTSDDVNVTATVTDADDNLSSVLLTWGETFQDNEITMELVSGDTWETSTPIPAQENLTEIQFTITATDADSNEGAAGSSYIVFDPFTGDLPFIEPFLADLGEMTAYDISGAQSWVFDEHDGEEYAYMSGFSGGPVANEDWLITPAIDFSAVSSVTLNFKELINKKDNTVNVDDMQEVYISTDFVDDPTTATWTELTITGRNPQDNGWQWTDVDEVDLSAYAGESSVHIGFKYQSTDTDNAIWEIDNIRVEEGVGIANTTVNNLSIYPNPVQNEVFVKGINGDAQVDIISMDGKVVMNKQIESNRVDVASLNEGLYIIRVISNNEVYTTRFVKE